MTTYKIVYIEGGAIGNRFVTYVEAEDATQAQLKFHLVFGYGMSIESISEVEDDQD